MARTEKLYLVLFILSGFILFNVGQSISVFWNVVWMLVGLLSALLFILESDS